MAYARENQYWNIHHLHPGLLDSPQNAYSWPFEQAHAPVACNGHFAGLACSSSATWHKGDPAAGL